MSDTIVKRSVSIAGHRTSVSLEAPFWDAALHRGRAGSIGPILIGEIDAGRDDQNLSSAIRSPPSRSIQEGAALRSAGRDPVLPAPQTSRETPR